MTDTVKVLAQAIPAAATLTTLYTVPGATSTAISTVTVTNQSAIASSFRLSVAVAGAADASKQYVYFDEPIPGTKAFPITLGLSLAATDVLRCQSANGSVSFNVFGVEIS